MLICPSSVQTLSPDTADAHSMRAQNRRLALRMIFDEESLSRADIARRTGLSRSTVSDIVSELIDIGVVEESHVSQSSGGRPPIALAFRKNAATVCGVELGTAGILTVMRNLGGKTLHSRHLAFDVKNNAQGTLQRVISEVRAGASELGISVNQIAGLGLAVPCPLHPERPDVLSERILPAWAGIHPCQHLYEALQIPIFLENDANLGALAESWWGWGRGSGDFAFVHLTEGVGAGLIVEGEIYHGASGIAGEIGHTTIDPNGAVCRCGLTGCLEAMIGSHAVVQAFDRSNIEEVVDLALDRDPKALDLLTQNGRYLGIALANLVNLFNPSVVVLSGPVTRAQEVIAPPIAQALKERALWASLDDTVVRMSELGPSVVAIGAATMVLEASLQNPDLLKHSIPVQR